ncbi:MAG: hypothetical protein A2855_00430 [Candidatus Liptonbacteria bacterium RIFCSPHIGHO2_01_FULL_57_28]|uniref:DUF5667 domain-containing protein n=1 Tax=Candidatus Liptonbacteria bacterium RIFCSPHIGHO2_01_FULL_57_28 TaxID=1798647 RepID=A0A1G2C8Z7_9BACT|nr:MAG: hypothetical protein A2855_00430 [Candidatus Liptonbacteria bacterium RIFCSPHIGHO2_01_FULL_57_28]
MSKLLITVALFVILFAGIGPLPAQAATACDLTPQVAELQAVHQNTSFDEIEYLNAEIFARRKLLAATIECDLADIAARVEAFSQMPDQIKLVPAYQGILEKLAESSQYYVKQRTVTQNLGLRDLKTAARAISDWRRTTHIPTITWADNFLIWADNQQFLEKASERLSQVSRVAFSLKLVNQGEINELFEKAKKNFDTAFAENDRARNALNQERPVLALAHIQTSLKALADTYQVFFTLQETLQRIVK